MFFEDKEHLVAFGVFDEYHFARGTFSLMAFFRNTGHFHRRLAAHLIDALVLLALGTMLFFGTVHSPFERDGDIVTVKPFARVPVLGALQIQSEYSPSSSATVAELMA